jgi:hypothetical protein
MPQKKIIVATRILVFDFELLIGGLCDQAGQERAGEMLGYCPDRA